MSEQINKLKPKKAINKAFLKVKPNRRDIEGFKSNLIQLLDRTNDTESEEFHKNLVTDFLKKTYYDPNHFINTKGRNDLVIHNGDKAKSSVGVIIEAKKPTNKSEMVTPKKLNVKAFQELVLYYLRERITQNNLEIKHLIITNINEWFIFDATTFDRLFAQNKKLVKQFKDFEDERLADTKTDFFYKQIAEPFINDIKDEVEFIHFNLKDYQKPLRNDDKSDDNKLIALFKLLSPEHLLKLPFANDSNTLDKRFYSELLHIIGLTETKEGNKKLIGRKDENERNWGSIIENTIIQLDSSDKISRLDQPRQYGNTYDERLFNVALELSITWINRILFLKLLEAQLITYHKGDRSYSFLSLEKIQNYDDLNSLFFQVLARKHQERNVEVAKGFEKVPYLNSSLFEPSEIEHKTLFISNLRDDKTIPILSNTVLKDQNGKKRKGDLSTLEYLFEFLDAYDFSSEGSEEIQEENKSLINASVLGLIFEKINGYKDGSFFTPGFITMYMCRETIRKAVVQKFNETKNWNCKDLDDLYDKIEDREEANEIVNSLKICDPAVGSGHFLVSALNEMITIKNDLKILQDRNGKRLKEYEIEVVNDELVVTDEDGELFDYNPNGKESQRIQETLFHEKQAIIENCLFGVDINPNSVKICRLRLWIELLKNAYYKNATELETLPNIDINIKCGNSLVSRFAIDADIKKALKKSKWSIDSYRAAVTTYRNAENKEQKREMEQLIKDIKSDLRTEISTSDPKVKKLQKLSYELTLLTSKQLFEMTKKEKAAWNKKVKKLTQQIDKLETEIEEIKNNKIFENAFEWRFEFPEVLNDDGDFMGFDVVIGNPPYFSLERSDVDYFSLGSSFKSIEKRGDIYTLFYEIGMRILSSNKTLCYITSSTWMRSNYGKSLRALLLEEYNPFQLIDLSDYPVFESATVLTNIIFISKTNYIGSTFSCLIKHSMKPSYDELQKFINSNSYEIRDFNSSAWSVSTKMKYKIRKKIEHKGISLKDHGYKISNGFRTGFNKAYLIDQETKEKLIQEDPDCLEIIKPILRGRDLKKYFATFANQFVIVVGHGKGQELEKSFPPIYKRLKRFEPELKNRGQVKNGQHHFLELDNHPSDSYLNLFEKPKIIYPEITKFLPFVLDNSHHFYSNNKTFFINGENLESLVSFLNSNLFKYAFSEIFPELQGKSRELRKVFMEQIPYFQPNPSTNREFQHWVNKILAFKDENPETDTREIESQIDQLVYQLYDLTDEEIEIVESAV